MDLQNVSSLVIPEGSVRTIHDKNNRLLWGKLSYDTKYVGNAVQDGSPTPDVPIAIQTVTGTQTVTVCGKNLFNKSNINAVSTGATWDGEVVTSKIFSNASNVNTQIYWPSDKVIPIEKPFIVSMEIRLTSGSTGSFSRIGDGYSGVFTAVEHPTITTQWQRYSYKSTPPEGFILRALIVRMSQINGQIQIRNIQVEFGQNASKYEPYNGTSHAVNLGSIELCKIGNYQDYVYKSGDDWYAHKLVGKTTYSGGSGESWNLFGNSSGFFIANSEVLAPLTATDVGTMAVKSEYYLNCDFNSIYNSLVDYGIALYGATSPRNRVCIRNKDIATVADFKTWLSTHNMTVYYALATPTDTEITDATLVGQLDVIHQFLTRYGYSATVSGSLPLIIDKTNL